MSKTFFKRPAIARRIIKQETFSKFISSSRLRKVQSLLHDGSGGDSGPNAILCSLGIDGRYNDGCKELADYLMFDFFDTQRTDIERTGLPEEKIDDIIFCIRHDAVDVYCNPVNIYYLKPYIMHWRNLRLHCMQDAAYEDDEAAEEFKIKSLINMVDGCSTVGIPYSRIGQKQQFDKMIVEKWPIIQAFALEDFGAGGFFTMKYEVTDISGSLWQIYQEMDPCVLEEHVTEQLPLFERQWKTMTTVIDVAKSDGLLNVTQETVSEPLRSYFQHGIASTNKNKHSAPNRMPFALFGVNTSRKNIESANTASSKSAAKVSSSGLLGSPALHMVCQVVSPKMPYSCTRTYFFSSPTPIHPSFTPKSPDAKHTSGEKDLRLLNSIYVAAVNAVQTAIKVYSGTLSVHQAEDEAVNVLSKLTKTFTAGPVSILSHLANGNNVKFMIEAQDNYNRRVDLVEGKPTPYVKLASLSVYDIPSVEHNGETLGSVVFSESFLDSIISLLRPDGSIDIDSEHTVLTNSIPHHITWPYLCGSKEALTHVQYKVAGANIPGFGTSLIQGDTTCLLSDNIDVHPLKDGQTFLYEEGLVFLHSQNSPVIIPKNQLQSIQLYDGDSPSVTALIIMQYKATLQQYLPQQFWSDNRMLLLAFTPKSKAYKKLFSEVLHKWKRSSCSVPMQVLGEELPDVLTDVHTALQRDYDASSATNPSKLKKVKSKIPSLTRYFEHFEASSCLVSAPVPKNEILPVIKLPYDVGSFDDNEETIITILGGIPGSHKENLCTTLTNLSKDDSRWAIIRTPPEKSTTFNPSSLQHKLTAVIQAAMKKRAAAGAHKKKKRILLVTPGFTDVLDVIQAVVSHPNKDIARKLKIGAVTVCIDSSNTYLTERYTFPKLLDQCAEGWVNNVLFTNSPSAKSQEVEAAKSLVRAVNSDLALIIAEFGEVTRTPDIELILSESAFSEGSLVRARHLSCPGWTIGKYRSGRLCPNFNDVILQFSQPLDRVKLINNLKALKNTHSPFPFTGNIYHLRGRISLTDSDTVFELQYVVTSGYLDLEPTDTPAQNAMNGAATGQFVVAFIGCDLKENVLKEWVRSCAKQKPAIKPNITRTDLSKSEVKKLQFKHRLDALPEGWFYNGSKYVSLGGERTDMHPEIEKFVEDHLENVNESIDKFNSEIEREEYHDLFE